MAESTDELRVLMSAYACEPGEGSEPGVGWNWVQQLADRCELWVMTRANNREVIEEALAKQPMPRVRWIYFDLPYWARFWKKGRRGIYLYYYLWQLGAYFTARRLHKQVGFNVVHHVTLVKYWMPSFLSLLPVPFVWGPVGGGESAPSSFYFSNLSSLAHESLRLLARFLIEFDPFVRATARRSVVALSTTEETLKRLRALGCGHAAICSQVALPTSELQDLFSLPHHSDRPFRVVSVGGLLHFKGFELGLKAFAQTHSRRPDSEYWIIGDGRERKRLTKIARNLCISDKVVFWGALKRSDVMRKLVHSDVLLHPSLHDSGAWVCAEAMAAGLPVICLDLGGPALQVTPATGIKVAAHSPEQVVRDLAAALSELAEDQQRRQAMGDAGRIRVNELFNWDTKGLPMSQMYRQAAERTGS